MAGQLVAFPTETVYGLGAHAFDTAAVCRIFEVKGRPRTDPIICHVPTQEAAERLVRLKPQGMALLRRLSERFWPGPLTIVAPARALEDGRRAQRIRVRTLKGRILRGVVVAKNRVVSRVGGAK